MTPYSRYLPTKSCKICVPEPITSAPIFSSLSTNPGAGGAAGGGAFAAGVGTGGMAGVVGGVTAGVVGTVTAGVVGTVTAGVVGGVTAGVAGVVAAPVRKSHDEGRYRCSVLRNLFGYNSCQACT